MNDEACCTCARLLASIAPQYDEKTEKALGQDRRLDCCNRVICGQCMTVCPAEFKEPCKTEAHDSAEQPSICDLL